MKKSIAIIFLLFAAVSQAEIVSAVYTDGTNLLTLVGSDGTNPVPIAFPLDFAEGFCVTNGVSIFGTGAVDRATVDPDGFLQLHGGATVWDDLRFPVTALRMGADKPPLLTAYKGGVVLAFEDQAVANNEQRVTFTGQIPHNYKEGSDVEIHVHWVPEDGTAGAVRWQITHSWANMGASFPAESALATNAVAPGVVDEHTYTSIGEVSGSGKTISSMFICELRRNSSNAGDTFTGKDAYLLEVDFHYEIDSLGSREEDEK